MDKKPILVLGATGYIGSRLVPALLDQGYRVRVGYRSINKLNQRVWSRNPNVFPFKLNVFDKESLEPAMSGCSIVYYLVHSMESSVKDFVEKDKIAAQNTILVAERTGIQRIIYLGGLGEEIGDQKLSKHLESRIEVAKILDSCSIPVTTLRAAIIIGTGSAAFEMMRYLTDRLPVMITPKWLRTKNQPIAIDNVLTYLLKVLDVPETTGNTYDIGGPDIITYKEFMESYAKISQLPKRIILPIPIFSPQISSYWIKLITGIPSSLARPLINGMKNEVIVKDHKIEKLIPQRLLGHKEAIFQALDPSQYQKLVIGRKDKIPPTWYHPGDSKWSGGLIFQRETKKDLDKPIRGSKLSPEQVRSILNKTKLLTWVLSLGYIINHLFQGRFSIPTNLWTSEDSQFQYQFSTHNLLPGKIFLTYKLDKNEDQRVELSQIFRIIPKGLLGTAYWFLLNPLFILASQQTLNQIMNALGEKSIENWNNAAS